LRLSSSGWAQTVEEFFSIRTGTLDSAGAENATRGTLPGFTVQSTQPENKKKQLKVFLKLALTLNAATNRSTITASG
jgi:hypothetical protein